MLAPCNTRPIFVTRLTSGRLVPLTVWHLIYPLPSVKYSSEFGLLDGVVKFNLVSTFFE